MSALSPGLMAELAPLAGYSGEPEALPTPQDMQMRFQAPETTPEGAGLLPPPGLSLSQGLGALSWPGETAAALALTYDDNPIDDMVIAAQEAGGSELAEIPVPDFDARLTSYFLRSSAIPDIPDMNPSDAEQIAQGVAQASFNASARMMQHFDQFRQGAQARMQRAEEDAFSAFQDSELAFQYGRPASEVRDLQARIEAGSSPDATMKEQIQARQAAALLDSSAEDASTPDPMRLWNNMDNGKQALFIILNAVAGAANAVAGNPNGPTPLGLLQQLMDRDFQAQKDAYEMRRGKVGEARSAYALAAQRTENAIQRELLTKDIMMAGLQMNAQAAGLGLQAQQIGEARRQYKANYAMEAWKARQAAAADNLRFMLTREAQKTKGQMRELSPAVKTKFASLQAAKEQLQALKQQFKKTSATAFLSQFWPGTDASNYDQRRKVLVQAIARGVHDSRMSDEDVARVDASVPSNWMTKVSANELFEAWEHKIDSELSNLSRWHSSPDIGSSAGAEPQETLVEEE